MPVFSFTAKLFHVPVSVGNASTTFNVHVPLGSSPQNVCVVNDQFKLTPESAPAAMNSREVVPRGEVR